MVKCLRYAPRTALILTWMLAVPSTSQADLYIAPGMTSEDTVTLTLGIDRDFPLDDWSPALSLRLTGSLLLLERHGGDNAALTLSPALRYTFADTPTKPFLEAGIGGALFLDASMEDRDLSTAFQFEDRLAAGLHLDGGSEIGLSATHYSNASIKKPNDGFEVYSLTYRHPL
ncbi:acyloxyacyl hydrolase [Aidingimonas halophila]|uniref:Lipid A 3-O-deacylase n=1 Tax=Aidingimonas halophila TaxID=574349 RepID=A0A1H2XBF9_9GAMM|nr:acyloxyacyl hydrolase [Aidingimonas halophila]GHC28478.1 lipid A deacylase [Aidingimonas halophila]SDW90233.1 lipid A 3-O-deacylase [Aidingimonas halophila]